MANKFVLETVFKGTDQTSSAIVSIQRAAFGLTTRLGRDFKAIDAVVGKVNSTLLGTGKALGVASVAGAAGLYALAQPGIQLEKTLASLNAVARPTAEQLEEITAKSLEVGRAFGFSAVEVASGMEAMSKQGLTVEQVLTGIGGVAAAAAADGSSLEETMGGLLATMTGLGKGAGDLQHIADVMAKAGDATAASIGSLSQSMSVFGPTARSLGITTEAAIGQLAILQDAGIDASSAGTTLTAVYSKLSAPMGRTGKALKKLGIDVRDAHKNMKPPEQLMQEIFAATQGIEGNVGKTAAITELVGLESQKALQNIAAAVGSGKYKKVMDDLTGSVDGYSDQVARLKQDSGAGSIAKMGASVEALQISLYGLVSGELRGVVDKTTAWITANEGLIASGAEEYIEDIKDNLPEIELWIGRIGKGLLAWAGLTVAVKGVRVAILGVEGALWLATTATQAHAVATGALATTEGVTTTAIVLGTTARWARNAATWAVTASQGAYNLAVGASTVLQTMTLSEAAGTVVRWARVGATGAATAAQWLYNTAMGAGTVAAGGLTAAIAAGSATFLAAATPIMPLIAVVGGLTASVLMLTTAWNSLMDTLGGTDAALGTLGKMWDLGTMDVALANDAYLNEQAGMSSNQATSQAASDKMERESAAQMAGSYVHSPTRSSHSSTSHTETAEIVVKDETGRAVVNQPRGRSRRTTLKPSYTGGF